MFLAEVPVDAHGERAAVLVPEPSADGRDVDAGLDAGKKQGARIE